MLVWSFNLYKRPTTVRDDDGVFLLLLLLLLLCLCKGENIYRAVELMEF